MVKKFKTKKRESLKNLTLKFIVHIFENNLIAFPMILTIDLQKISKAINTNKRRLYDLTNVFEGIGYLKKIKRNHMIITSEFVQRILILKYTKITTVSEIEEYQNSIRMNIKMASRHILNSQMKKKNQLKQKSYMMMKKVKSILLKLLKKIFKIIIIKF